MDEYDVIAKALEYTTEHPDHWGQGRLYRRDFAPSCALGLLRWASEDSLSADRAVCVVSSYLPVVGSGGGIGGYAPSEQRVYIWNDAPDTTQADVAELFRKALARRPAVLAREEELVTAGD